MKGGETMLALYGPAYVGEWVVFEGV